MTCRKTRPIEKSATPNNLPALLTTFIGREKEQAEIVQWIGTHRLVTLTGSGGVGKTRLSLKVGGQILEQVWQRGLVGGTGTSQRPGTFGADGGFRVWDCPPILHHFPHAIAD